VDVSLLQVQRVIVFCQQSGSILHKFSIMESVEFPNGVAASNACDKIYISDNQSHCVKVCNQSLFLDMS